MKRYLIFAALGPLLGGFLLLIATTVMSGYFTQTNLAEVKKFFVVFAKTLQYAYLFGIVPALMMAAIDDILLQRQKNWLGGPDPDRRRDRVRRGGAAFWFAGCRQRRGPVPALWPGRLCPDDAFVVAGAPGRAAARDCVKRGPAPGRR